MKKLVAILALMGMSMSLSLGFAMDFYNYETKEERYWDESYCYKYDDAQERIDHVVEQLREEGFIPDYEVPENDWVTLVADDGRTIKTVYPMIDVYVGLGWHYNPTVTMYSWDGKTATFSQEEVEAQKAVGWYTQPFVTMYTLDGRSQEFSKSEVEAQKQVGWYEKAELDRLKWEQAEEERRQTELVLSYDDSMNGGDDGTYLWVQNCKQSITLRATPSANGRAITQMPPLSCVKNLGYAGNGFYKVSYLGKTGYALSDYLGMGEGLFQGDGTYEVVNCNSYITLRTTASFSAESDVLTNIPLGAYVNRYYYPSQNGFYLVSYNDYVGWASAEYLQYAY